MESPHGRRSCFVDKCGDVRPCGTDLRFFQKVKKISNSQKPTLVCAYILGSTSPSDLTAHIKRVSVVWFCHIARLWGTWTWHAVSACLMWARREHDEPKASNKALDQQPSCSGCPSFTLPHVRSELLIELRPELWYICSADRNAPIQCNIGKQKIISSASFCLRWSEISIMQK